MVRDSDEGIIDTASRQRLIFPAWIDPKQRRIRAKQKRLIRNGVGIAVLLITIVVIGRVVRNSHDLGTDTVLGKPLSSRDIAELGIPESFGVSQTTAVPHGNPWRGSGRRRRHDLITSVSGCGGTYRRSLRRGDVASLYYVFRAANGKIDSTRKGVPVDVTLGSYQIGKDVEAKLEGLCAGEAVSFRLGSDSYLIFVARVGSLSNEDQEAIKLERLARVLKQVGANRGASCSTACRKAGLTCTSDGFKIINSCPRLRMVFQCRACEVAAAGSSGPDMPCHVEMSAPKGHPRGYCMVNPRIDTATCDAKYIHTRRLCPCVLENTKT